MSKSDRRAAARLAAVQALYQMEVAAKSVEDVCSEFEAYWIGKEVEGDRYNDAELGFFRAIVAGVQQDQFAIDQTIDRPLAEGWPLKRIEALMRAILRAAFYELKSRSRRAGPRGHHRIRRRRLRLLRKGGERHDQRGAGRARPRRPAERVRGRVGRLQISDHSTQIFLAPNPGREDARGLEDVFLPALCWGSDRRPDGVWDGHGAPPP